VALGSGQKGTAETQGQGGPKGGLTGGEGITLPGLKGKQDKSGHNFVKKKDSQKGRKYLTFTGTLAAALG